jgi:hypothetical protein
LNVNNGANETVSTKQRDNTAKQRVQNGETANVAEDSREHKTEGLNTAKQRVQFGKTANVA